MVARHSGSFVTTIRHVRRQGEAVQRGATWDAVAVVHRYSQLRTSDAGRRARSSCCRLSKGRSGSLIPRCCPVDDGACCCARSGPNSNGLRGLNSVGSTLGSVSRTGCVAHLDYHC